MVDGGRITCLYKMSVEFAESVDNAFWFSFADIRRGGIDTTAMNYAFYV